MAYPSFAERLQAQIDRLAAERAEVANLLRIDEWTLCRWLTGAEVPHFLMQLGAIHSLSRLVAQRRRNAEIAAASRSRPRGMPGRAYEVTRPDGTVETVTNLYAWAKQRGIGAGGYSALTAKRKGKFAGYSARRIDSPVATTLDAAVAGELARMTG